MQAKHASIESMTTPHTEHIDMLAIAQKIHQDIATIEQALEAAQGTQAAHVAVPVPALGTVVAQLRQLVAAQSTLMALAEKLEEDDEDDVGRQITDTIVGHQVQVFAERHARDALLSAPEAP